MADYPVYPELPGVSIDVKVSPEFNTNIQEHVGGKESSVSYQQYPTWLYELSYEFLPSDPKRPHLQQIQGFFLRMRGKHGRFLFTAPTGDFTMANNEIAVGDGTETSFYLSRSIGGYLEPIGRMSDNIAVKTGSTTVPDSDYTISGNVITFDTAPGDGESITISGDYYMVCRFEDDSADYSQFGWKLWEAQSVSIRSVIGR